MKEEKRSRSDKYEKYERSDKREKRDKYEKSRKRENYNEEKHIKREKRSNDSLRKDSGSSEDALPRTISNDKHKKPRIVRKLYEFQDAVLSYGLAASDYTKVWRRSRPKKNLLRKMNEAVESMKSVYKAAEKEENTLIPYEVVTLIDEGQNPDLWTSSISEQTVTENQFTNGKLFSIGSFADRLGEKMAEKFKDDPYF